VEWRLDSLKEIGGHAVSTVGAPRAVQTEIGPAVEFDGAFDGLFLDTNPLQGLERFTIEVVFQPAADGPEEQRFLHIEEPGTGSRALIELRMLPGAMWSLDTYLRTRDTGVTLLDRRNAHPAGRWYAAALAYDGRTMTHYVNGVPELSGAIAFSPLTGGRTSIGVRQNRVSWFKGRIHAVRITPEALPPDRLMRPPQPGRQAIVLWPEGVPGAKPDGGEERIVDGACPTCTCRCWRTSRRGARTPPRRRGSTIRGTITTITTTTKQKAQDQCVVIFAIGRDRPDVSPNGVRVTTGS
jgi:hypothetical protein